MKQTLLQTTSTILTSNATAFEKAGLSLLNIEPDLFAKACKLRYDEKINHNTLKRLLLNFTMEANLSIKDIYHAYGWEYNELFDDMIKQSAKKLQYLELDVIRNKHKDGDNANLVCIADAKLLKEYKL